MLLSTPAFFVFFLLIWLLFWTLVRQPAARMAVLVAANLFFLAKFGALYLLLPAAATVDFLVGLGLAPEAPVLRRRALLAVSLTVNLGLLLATKLIPFTVGDRYTWLLTLSLSFYCFQSLTYTVDLYRREEDAEPTRSLPTYLASALFFPTMVAGPILRLHDFLRQLTRPPVLTQELAGRALLLIGIGLVKKLLIADYLAENLVTRVFDTPTLYSGARSPRRRLRLRPPALLRLLRLHRHRPRRRPPARPQAPGKLQPPLPRPQPDGLLAPLAHLVLHLAPRLHPRIASPRIAASAPWPPTSTPSS